MECRKSLIMERERRKNVLIFLPPLSPSNKFRRYIPFSKNISIPNGGGQQNLTKENRNRRQCHHEMKSKNHFSDETKRKIYITK